MNKDIVAGKAKQIEGRLQDAKGDLTDNPRDDAAGKAKVTEGKIQEGIGKAKEALKRSVDKL
jgi:uncharacterized protein YjbJ (UPF0337 family)